MDISKALSIPGYMWEMHLEWLAQHAMMYRNIIELGSFYGRSTRALCDNAIGHVWAVDLWETDISGGMVPGDTIFEAFKNNMADAPPVLTVVRMSTVDAYHKYFIPSFGYQSFDMVFIDADHTYEAVKQDIMLYANLIKPGGLVTGHDLNWDGVRQAVDELLPGYKNLEYLWWRYV